MKIIHVTHLTVCFLSHCIAAFSNHVLKSKKDQKNPEQCNACIGNIARNFLTTAYGVQFHGDENINKDKPVLYVLRHATDLDAFVIASIHEKCKYITKPGVLKLPIASFSAKNGQQIIVDVKDKESRKQCKEKIIALFQQGYSVAVFPEGTLRRNRKKLGKFHTASIEIACEMGIPISVVRICDFPIRFFDRSSAPTVIFEPAQIYIDTNEAIFNIRKRLIHYLQQPTSTSKNQTICKLLTFVILLIVIQLCIKKQCLEAFLLLINVFLLCHYFPS